MKIALAALALILPLSAGAATVTLDSTLGGNAGMLGTAADGSVTLDTREGVRSTPVYLTLAAGSYDVTALGGAWNRWGTGVAGCAADGTRCTQGHEWSFGYFLPDSATPTSTTMVRYNLPFTPSFYDSAASALQSVMNTTVAHFDLASEQRVGFFIYDDFVGDNRGSVSFEVLPQVAPVPLPAAGVLLLSGFGGLAALRRRGKRA